MTLCIIPAEPVPSSAKKAAGWEGDHVTMVRNEDYWGEKPGITSVTITEVPEAGTRTAMLQTGEADMVYPVTSDQIPAVEGIEGVTLTSGESNIMRYVTLNTNIAGLDDVNVRQALNYATTRMLMWRLCTADTARRPPLWYLRLSSTMSPRKHTTRAGQSQDDARGSRIRRGQPPVSDSLGRQYLPGDQGYDLYRAAA